MRRIWVVVLLVILASSVGATPEEAAEAPPWEEAEQFKVKPYRIKTNLGQDYAEQTGDLLSALEAKFRDFCKGSAIKLRRVSNLPVTLFANRVQYKEFMRGFRSGSGDGFGYYDTKSGMIYAYRRLEDGHDVTHETLLHEGIHQLVHQAANGCKTRNKPGYWIEEGLADYFAGMVLTQGMLEPGLRQIRFDRAMTMLAEDGFKPLGEFVVGTREGFGSEDYAQSMVLTHFFVTTQEGKLKRQFLAYVKRIIQSRGAATTFRKAFRCDPSTFDEDFLKHVVLLKQQALAPPAPR